MLVQSNAHTNIPALMTGQINKKMCVKIEQQKEYTDYLHLTTFHEIMIQKGEASQHVYQPWCESASLEHTDGRAGMYTSHFYHEEYVQKS